MEIIVGGKSPESKKEKVEKKFIELSDKLGELIIDKKSNISKEDIKNLFKRKRNGKKRGLKSPKTLNIPELIKSYFKKKDKNQPPDKRRLGMIVLGGIILITIVIIGFIISLIIDYLLSIMEWWVLFALFVVLFAPIFLAIAFFIATDSNDEVYNLK